MTISTLNPDYKKLTFTDYEKNLMKKQSFIITNKYPDKVPILIRLQSKYLSTTKYKYLIPSDMIFKDVIKGISEKIEDCNGVSLLFSISTLKDEKTNLTPKMYDIPLKELYDQYKDTEIDVLILNVQRHTLYIII
jgi:hypothetical protein